VPGRTPGGRSSFSPRLGELPYPRHLCRPMGSIWFRGLAEAAARAPIWGHEGPRRRCPRFVHSRNAGTPGFPMTGRAAKRPPRSSSSSAVPPLSRAEGAGVRRPWYYLIEQTRIRPLTSSPAQRGQSPAAPLDVPPESRARRPSAICCAVAASWIREPGQPNGRSTPYNESPRLRRVPRMGAECSLSDFPPELRAGACLRA